MNTGRLVAGGGDIDSGWNPVQKPLRVSDLPTWRYGEEQWKKEAVVHHGLQITDEHSNKDELYGKFPEEGALLAFLHDLTIELDLQAYHGQPPSPPKQSIRSFMDEVIMGIKGKDELPHGNHMKKEIGGLQEDYGIPFYTLIDSSAEAYGKSVTAYMDEIAESRADDWSPLDGAEEVEAEAWLEGRGLRGKADIIVDDTVREVKVVAGNPSLPRVKDLYQAIIYANLAGAERIEVDYPVQGVTAERRIEDIEIPAAYRITMDRNQMGRAVRDLRIEQAENLREITGEPFIEGENAREYRDRVEKAYRGDFRQAMRDATEAAVDEVFA
jgi:hypothetical protein